MSIGRSQSSSAPGLGLLMFNLEENDGILRNARALSSTVDEIVVIDNSSPATRERLREELAPLGGRVVPAVPLGYADLLRPFGTAQVVSEWVLQLDADEELSPTLHESLRSLRDHDAYVLPRLEVELGSLTYHMRLFRKDAVQYLARSYDFPSVRGSVGYPDREHCIVHRARYGHYFEDKGRSERYFFIENVERPMVRGYLRDAFTMRLGDRGLPLPGIEHLARPADTPLSPPLVRGVIEWEFLRDTLLGKGLRAARFNRLYGIEKARFLERLPAEQRAWIALIAQEVRAAGGLVGYLGLRDPALVERLTSSFGWDKRGIDVLRDLLAYRHTHGHPMESFPPERTSAPPRRESPGPLTVSVGIPTHDRPERVTALLESLEEARVHGLQSVLIVDDSPEPVDFVSRFPGLPIDLLRLRERAFISRAKNLGWRRARSDLVYFIDDDNVVSRETFTGPLEAMAADPSLGAVVPAVLYHRRPDLVWVYATPWAEGRWGHTLIGRNQPRVAALEGQLLDTDALPNASLIRRAAFEQTGGFSEALAVNSSAEAAMRLKRAGWKVRAHTGAFIRHDVEPPGEFGYWARHGAADPERVYHEVRDWFLLMRSVHEDVPWFRLQATVHALGFLLPNAMTYLLRGGARGRASFRNLISGYLGGLRATSRRA